MNENAFAFIVQARPCPTFCRPVHLRGSPHRLQPGTSPHALRIPPRDGHPALQRTSRSGSRSTLAVSGFRFRARLGFSIPASFPWPARHYPRVRIQRSSFERRGDFNPHEQYAAQHTLRNRPTPHRRACWTSGSRPSPTGPPPITRRAPMGSPGSRARSFPACQGSQTARSPSDARVTASDGVAFRHAERRRHPNRDYFAAQYPACTSPCQRFDGSLTAGHA